MPAPDKTLTNAAAVEVVYLDGAKATVSVRDLTLRQLYTFAELTRNSNTPGLVALCCDKPIEWVDTLSDESFGALTAHCVEANFQRAMRIGDRDPVMAALIGPAMATGVLSVAAMLPAVMMEEARKRVAAGNIGPDSSAAPAPSASAAATGSA